MSLKEDNENNKTTKKPNRESEKQKIRDRSNPKSNDEETGNDVDDNNKNKENKVGNNYDQKITRCNVDGAEEFEDEYDIIDTEMVYNRYNQLYEEKARSIQKWVNSIKQNSEYFNKMKGLIKSEKDTDKKLKMRAEFRKIYEERAGSIKKMKAAVAKTNIELQVIKNRINDYVSQQRQQLDGI